MRLATLAAITAILLLADASASAQVTPPAPVTSVPRPAPAASIPVLQAINVTGVVPGPGLWKVTRGEHVLWILGVVATVPEGIRWQPAEVTRVIATSQAVLAAPEVKVKVNASWFGKLFLLLPVRDAQRNPDGKTLAQVLPAPLYARWQAQRQAYFGDDRGIERYRPIIAASKLLKRALAQHGLRSSGKIEDTITALARERGVQVVDPATTLEIRHPHAAVKEFARQGPDGLACFGEVLDAIENGIPGIRERANAWATGDIDTLHRVPAAAYHAACESAIFDAGFAKSLGIDDLPARVESAWLAAVDAALATNAQSFAVLPMHELLDPHGYVAALQVRGYSVTAPAAAAEPAAAGSTATAATGATPASSE